MEERIPPRFWSSTARAFSIAREAFSELPIGECLKALGFLAVGVTLLTGLLPFPDFETFLFFRTWVEPGEGFLIRTASQTWRIPIQASSLPWLVFGGLIIYWSLPKADGEGAYRITKASLAIQITVTILFLISCTANQENWAALFRLCFLAIAFHCLVKAGDNPWARSHTERAITALGDALSSAAQIVYRCPTPFFLVAAGLLFFLISSVVCFGFYQNRALDEQTTAQIVLAGRLTHIAWFPSGHRWERVLHWITYFPSGYSLLQAIGGFFSISNWISPVFGALTVIPLYIGGRAGVGETAARVAVALFLISPFAWFATGAVSAYSPILFFSSCASAAFILSLKKSNSLAAVLVGVFIGLRFSFAPSLLVAAAPAWIFAWLRWGRSAKKRRILIVSLASTLFFLAQIYLLRRIALGDAFHWGYELTQRPDVGSLPRFTILPAATPSDRLMEISLLNTSLFALPIPCLSFLFFLFNSGRFRSWDLWMLCALVGSFFVSQTVTSIPGSLWPMTLVDGLPFLFWLTSRGIRITAYPWQMRLPSYQGRQLRRNLQSVFLIIIWLLGTAFNLPGIFQFHTKHVPGFRIDRFDPRMGSLPKTLHFSLEPSRREENAALT